MSRYECRARGSAIALQQAAEALSGLDDRAGPARNQPMRLRFIDAEIRSPGVQAETDS